MPKKLISECLGMWKDDHLVQRCGLAASREPVWLSSYTHRTPIIALMCTFRGGGALVPVARHLEVPDSVRNVLESVAEDLIPRPPLQLVL